LTPLGKVDSSSSLSDDREKQGVQNQPALHRTDQHWTLLVVKTVCVSTTRPVFAIRVGKQTVYRSLYLGQIIPTLEIDRADFLYRDELPHVDAAVGFGLPAVPARHLRRGRIVLSEPRSRAPSRRARSRDLTDRANQLIASRTFCAVGESECCGLRWPNRVRPGWRPAKERTPREMGRAIL
jgi:hypothetical protein